MQKQTIKRKISGKSFRLIDFHYFNKNGSLDSESESEDEDELRWGSLRKQSFIIQMFGINEKGQTCSIYINDYKPFF